MKTIIRGSGFALMFFALPGAFMPDGKSEALACLAMWIVGGLLASWRTAR